MNYKSVLYESQEGIAVSRLAMLGYESQGEGAEAIKNIQDAIQDYFTVVEEPK